MKEKNHLVVHRLPLPCKCSVIIHFFFHPVNHITLCKGDPKSTFATRFIIILEYYNIRNSKILANPLFIRLPPTRCSILYRNYWYALPKLLVYLTEIIGILHRNIFSDDNPTNFSELAKHSWVIVSCTMFKLDICRNTYRACRFYKNRLATTLLLHGKFSCLQDHSLRKSPFRKERNRMRQALPVCIAH